MRYVLAGFIVIWWSPAPAQQQPELTKEQLQGVFTQVQQQRNAVMDALAASQAKIIELTEELRKLKEAESKGPQQ
jgi:uncharacterized membrane-anchored protein YhcB (DUF1043 family)